MPQWRGSDRALPIWSNSSPHRSRALALISFRIMERLLVVICSVNNFGTSFQELSARFFSASTPWADFSQHQTSSLLLGLRSTVPYAGPSPVFSLICALPQQQSWQSCYGSASINRRDKTSPIPLSFWSSFISLFIAPSPNFSSAGQIYNPAGRRKRQR